MQVQEPIIRKVKVRDAKALLKIYEPYVLNTAITYEYKVPSLREFKKRIRKTLRRYPYICALVDGQIVGYAYAGAFHPREAYRWSAELSIYISQKNCRSGIGKLLYAELEDALVKQGIVNAYACIAVPSGKEDEYLTFNSKNFHEHLGYTLVGTFDNCAKKFGRWYGMVWMHKSLAPLS